MADMTAARSGASLRLPPYGTGSLIMGERPRLHRRRRAGAIALLTAITLSVGVIDSPDVAAAAGLRAKMLRFVNAARERHDVAALRLHADLSKEAMRHTRKMIRLDRIFDPRNLQEILEPFDWSHLGAAAVGCGDSPWDLHRRLMRSPVHREILLHPDLRRVGIGAVKTTTRNRCGRGSIWVTQIFYG
jgi:uncharacterized protein YkwD